MGTKSGLQEQVQGLMTRVAELEAQLGGPPKNSSNSSLPSSKDFKANANKDNAKGGKDGKSKRPGPRQGSLGRKGKHRSLAANPDEIVRVMAKACGQCSGTLREADQTLHHAYDKVDIPPVKPVVTRVEIYREWCLDCSHATAPSAVPEGMEEGSPFSLNIAAPFICALCTRSAMSGWCACSTIARFGEKKISLLRGRPVVQRHYL
jgi:transposase